MTKRKYWLKKLVFIIILTLLFINSTFFPILKSYTIMSIYSKIHENSSFLTEENIRIQIPGGWSTLKNDYFPFVIVFDPSDSFSRYINEPVDLTIYYNFGAFDLWKGASSLYNPSSPYYTTFYGAYAVRYKDADKIYGLTKERTPDINAITQITDFDMKYLVYNSVGNMNPNLEYNIEEGQNTMVIDGHEFIVFDATIQMEGMWHQQMKDYRAYIQYGKPPLYSKQSFEEVQGYGRIYLYYDEVNRISYFFYIITTDMQTLEYTEEFFIKSAKIVKNN